MWRLRSEKAGGEGISVRDEPPASRVGLDVSDPDVGRLDAGIVDARVKDVTALALEVVAARAAKRQRLRHRDSESSTKVVGEIETLFQGVTGATPRIGHVSARETVVAGPREEKSGMKQTDARLSSASGGPSEGIGSSSSEPHPSAFSDRKGGLDGAYGSATDAEIRQFAELVSVGDNGGALDAIERFAADGISYERVLLDIFPRTAVVLGEDWRTDRKSFVDVGIGVALLERLVGTLTPRVLSSAPKAATGTIHRPRIAVTFAIREQHTLGARIAGVFFQREGWDVQIEPDSAALLRTYTDDAVSPNESDPPLFDVVAVAVCSEDAFDEARAVISAIRSAQPRLARRIMVAGRAITLEHGEDESFLSDIGADFAVADVRFGPWLAARALRSDALHPSTGLETGADDVRPE